MSVEILAPCGSKEALIAAVRAGADAVYLGLGALNARQNAQNFSDQELDEMARYLRLNGVKLYITLNTMVFDHELKTAASLIRTAVLAGADAFIVQDLGVARLIKQMCPDANLCASTQMAVHNLDGVRLLEEMGFHRAVLARELSEKEIFYIKQHSHIELEVFVHGALCMGMSGQCYLSSFFGGRSGNRGLCAQPCRLSYQCQNKQGTLLSLKDLSLVEYVRALEAMGIASLKIEGRMKRPEYVAAAVSACRQARDQGFVDDQTQRALFSVFSRSGFTDGYFTGNVNAEMFGHRTKEDVAQSSSVLKELAQLYKSEYPRIGVDMTLLARQNAPITLTAADSGGHTAKVEGEAPQKAIHRATTKEDVQKSLTKTGGTPFYLKDLACQIEDGLALSAASLNALRREALEELSAQRKAFTPPEIFKPQLPQKGAARPAQPQTPPLRGFFQSCKQVLSSAVQQLELVALPLEEVLQNRESIAPWAHKCMAVLPHMRMDETRLPQQLNVLGQMGVRHLYLRTIGDIYACRGKGFVLHGGFTMNMANTLCLNEYRALGLCDIEQSVEMALDLACTLPQSIPTGMMAYGNLPLMTVRNCPVKASIGCQKCKRQGVLYDRMKEPLRVLCYDNKRYCEIHNPHPLFLADRLPELSFAAFLSLYFVDETPEQCAQVIHAYQTGVKAPQSGFTRGHCYKHIP